MTGKAMLTTFSLGASLLCLLLTAAVQAAGIGKVTVTADQAPVMSGKDVVQTARKGDVLEASEIKGDWYGVLPTRGWIHKSNVRFEPAAPAGAPKASASGVAAPVAPAVPRATGTPPEPVPLAETAEIDRMVGQAIIAIPDKSPGRKFLVSSLSGGGLSEQDILPVLEQLPEKVVLVGAPGQCQVTLGWRWVIETKNGKTAEPRAPAGALMRLDAPLALASGTLPAGTNLVRGQRGWGVISDADAVSVIRGMLAMRPPKCVYGQAPRETAAIGAAVLGPAAVSLIGDLAKAGITAPAECAFALGRIGDKSALPALREMRAKDLPGIVATIDAAIAAIEKAPANSSSSKYEPLHMAAESLQGFISIVCEGCGKKFVAPAANQPPPPPATATHTFSGYLERGFMLGGGGEIPKCLDPSRRWVRASPEQEVVGRKVLAAVSANSGNPETIAFMALSVSQAMRQTVEGKPTADMLHIVAMSRKDLPATGIFKDPIRFQPGPVTTVAEVCKQFGAATEKETWSGKSFQDMGMSDTVWWWGQVGVAASADGTITHILVRRPVEEAK